MDRLRVGLLGCGRIARVFHLPILAGLPGVKLAAVADPDPAARARAGAGAPGAVVVADWREVVADPRVDAIVVCLPSGMHAEAAGAAFAAGHAVYLEKPIATDLEDGRAILRAWRSSGAVGMAGFDQRFEPAIRALRNAARAGTAGPVTGLRLAMGSGRRDAPAWKRSRATGGGVLLDLGSHLVDLARFVLAEEVRTVAAVTASALTEDDTAAIALTMESGRLAQAWVTLAGITESRVEVVGQAGMLVADRYAGTVELLPLEPAWSRPARARRGLARLGREARALLEVAQPLDLGVTYRGALAAFVEAARARRSSPPDLADGFRSLAVVLAAEESARTGRAATPAAP